MIFLLAYDDQNNTFCLLGSHGWVGDESEAKSLWTDGKMDGGTHIFLTMKKLMTGGRADAYTLGRDEDLFKLPQ